ncbi:MAG TPA: hypothetical protein VHB01_04275 [Nitrosospira sp.]|nr:hypothetical protein [Nitrosospira sp.]
MKTDLAPAGERVKSEKECKAGYLFSRNGFGHIKEWKGIQPLGHAAEHDGNAIYWAMEATLDSRFHGGAELSNRFSSSETD